MPANAVATVGQTSLLGSMHVELNPPLGQRPTGQLAPGTTIALDRSSSYPSTEQTLSALSVVLNSGGLGQIGDIVHNFSTALSGHENDVRELLTRLDEFVGVLDQQRDRIVASIDALNRLAGTFASQRQVISDALRKIPPALDVLIRERPRFTAALDKLRVFSNTTTRLVNDAQADLVKNLQNLEPTMHALADVGPDLGPLLGYLPTFPFTQNFVDRAIRGDYFNVFAVIDMTVPRLKRTIGAGTRWGDPDAPLVPAPGDPWYQSYTRDPLSVGIAPPPAAPAGGRPRSPVSVAPDMSPIAPLDHPGGGPMLTRFVRIQLIDLHRRVGDRDGGDVLRLHAGADAARDRPAHRQIGVTRHRRPVPVQQCHLPRSADRQGDRGGSDARTAPKRRCRSTPHPRSRRTCMPRCAAFRRSANSTWTWCRARSRGPTCATAR